MFDQTREGAVIKTYTPCGDDRSAWWWLFSVYGYPRAIAFAMKWGM